MLFPRQKSKPQHFISASQMLIFQVKPTYNSDVNFLRQIFLFRNISVTKVTIKLCSSFAGTFQCTESCTVLFFQAKHFHHYQAPCQLRITVLEEVVAHKYSCQVSCSCVAVTLCSAAQQKCSHPTGHSLQPC